MKALKNLYKEFFGLNEQDQSKKFDHEQQALYNKELEKTAQLMKSMTEADLDEAQLVNHITDYRGGIEYVLRNPAEAKAVAQEIKEWSERKGFTVVKHTISPSGKIGYFYFRLGQDPGLESQKLQGYLAQKPELKHFRFNVRQQKPKAPQPEI